MSFLQSCAPARGRQYLYSISMKDIGLSPALLATLLDARIAPVGGALRDIHPPAAVLLLSEGTGSPSSARRHSPCHAYTHAGIGAGLEVPARDPDHGVVDEKRGKGRRTGAILAHCHSEAVLSRSRPSMPPVAAHKKGAQKYARPRNLMIVTSTDLC